VIFVGILSVTHADARGKFSSTFHVNWATCWMQKWPFGGKGSVVLLPWIMEHIISSVVKSANKIAVNCNVLSKFINTSFRSCEKWRWTKQNCRVSQKSHDLFDSLQHTFSF